MGLKLKKNEKDSQRIMNFNLDMIAKALEQEAGTWSVEVEDPEEFNEGLLPINRDKLYSICYEQILGGLMKNIKSLARDELVRDGIADVVSENRIVIRMDNDMEPSQYPGAKHDVSIDGGAIVITCKGESARAATQMIGYKIKDLL